MPNTKEMLGALKKFDTDDDGQLTVRELLAILMRNDKFSFQDASWCVRQLSGLDADGDGKVSCREIAEKLSGKAPTLQKKPIKEFSGDEIRSVLAIFKQFDANADGMISSAELQTLMAILMVEGSVDEADKYTKDGMIDPKEFFAFYTGCTPGEAANAFVHHAQQFDQIKGKGSIKEYSAQEVKDVLAIFKQFDADNSGTIDASELQNLAAVLMLELTLDEADTLTKDGKVVPTEFFKFYTGCSLQEAEQAFEQHTMAFASQ